MQSQKRKRCPGNDMGRDRLSEMPDEVIVHILSCMPTLDAVRTVLLRRFGNLWTSVHSIDFSIYRNFLNNPKSGVGRFYFCVRNVLMLHNRPSINKFHLCVHPECYGRTEDSIRDGSSGDIEASLRFALTRKAKEIIFDYMSNHDFDVYNTSLFPKFTSQSLVTLELSGCRIHPTFQVDLPSLKKLLLDDISMCDKSFQQLISGCPSLQELCIVNPCEIDRLRFTSLNIRKLSLHVWNMEEPILLDFPNLKCLELNTSEIPRIIDISAVRDIYIKGSFDFWKTNDTLPVPKLFLGKFEGSDVFRLSRNAELFLHSLHDLHLLQLRWKRVVLELGNFCESCIVGISELLRSLKNLEELVIRTTLKGAEEVELLKRVSTFERASPNAKVFFV